MITKQQALEFIYELSKLHVVHLDVPCGYAYIDKEEYEYRAWENNHTLEALVTEIIKDNMGNALLMNFNKIPVDVDMLEVGQTYRLGTGETLYLKDITEYKLIFTHTKINIIFGIDKEDIKEIYKVNEHANM